MAVPDPTNNNAVNDAVDSADSSRIGGRGVKSAALPVMQTGGDGLHEVGEIDDDGDLLLLTAREAMGYFENPALHDRGFVRDSARPGAPCSVAAAGFAAAAWVCACDLGITARETARRHVAEIATAMRSLTMADTVRAADLAGGYRGWFYHFLKTDEACRGEREWKCELSSIDTALLLAGLLVAAAYFDEDDQDEAKIRADATAIYDAVDWQFLIRDGGWISHGWRPEATRHERNGHDRRGYISCNWTGYNEGLLLYLLALGATTQDVSPDIFKAWQSTYDRHWVTTEGIEHLHCPPLFVHQFPHSFCDFRGVACSFLNQRGTDYFENSRRATEAHIAYAKRNPLSFDGYDEHLWGISASNGPGIDHRKRLTRDGRRLQFHGYVERGVTPPGHVVDDGTLAPWAAAASLPFLPKATIAGIRAHRHVTLCRPGWSGFMGSYNLTYVAEDCPHGWVDEYDLAIEQAPITMMIANHLNDTIWRLTREPGPLRRGMERAGLAGGWMS